MPKVIRTTRKATPRVNKTVSLRVEEARELDRAARRASIGGEPLDLSPREWTLLDLLVSERDRVVTKPQIVAAWGGEDSAGGSIEVYIHRLRKKLEGSGLAVRTVRGLGYLLEATGASLTGVTLTVTVASTGVSPSVTV